MASNVVGAERPQKIFSCHWYRVG